MIEIKKSFEIAISSIIPVIQTAYENVSFTPTNGIPYQELTLIPAYNDNPFIDNSGYISYGIFQVKLFYPTSSGTKDILDRIKLYLDFFTSGKNLTQSGITINVLNTPSVKNAGVVGDRLVYILSINYQAFY